LAAGRGDLGEFTQQANILVAGAALNNIDPLGDDLDGNAATR